MIEGLDLAREAARYADNKNADDIQILDLRGVSTITDFFVICSGGSMPHLKAIQKEIREKLKEEHDLVPHLSEGQPESLWVVLDYVDVMVHIFHHTKRGHYALETLWSDAPRIEFTPSVAAQA